MRLLTLGLLGALSLSGCIVVTERRGGPPPAPPPATSTSISFSYGWNHHRYVVWREYYACTPEEVYWLENCGYDDDDILVCLMMARHARVPIRHVFYEYGRCGRSLFTCASIFGVAMSAFFCNEVPVNYACPPLYARAYGYHWRRQHHYYSNAEFHALIHLQIGIRYYGYRHDQYFREHDACVARGDRFAFRSIVVKEPHRAGHGNRTCDDRPLVKIVRPWDGNRDPRDWDKKREVERQEIRVKFTPQRDREEEEEARKAAERDDRKRVVEDVRAKVEKAKKDREEADRREPLPAYRPQVGKDDRNDPKDAPKRDDVRRIQPVDQPRVEPLPRQPGRVETPPPAERKPVKDSPKPPPPAERKPEKDSPKPPPPVERKAPPREQPKAPPPVERKAPPPPPPVERKAPPPDSGRKNESPKNNSNDGKKPSEESEKKKGK